jgi:small subunit ribosomal protein S16
MGRKKRPVYAIVAADTRSPRDGRFIEDLGRYNPLEEPASYELKSDRILYWLQTGAQPTDTVKALLSREGIMLELHMRRKNRTEEEITSAVEAHRIARAEKAASSGKTTAEERRVKAMKEEEKRAERAAELAKERSAAAAKAKEEAAVALAAAEANREAAAQAAKAEQAEANAAQAAAEAPAAAPVVEEAPAEVPAEEVVAEAAAPEVAEEVAPEAPVAEEAAPADAEEASKES